MEQASPTRPTPALEPKGSAVAGAALPQPVPTVPQTVVVEIYDQIYHLRGVDPEYIERLAAMVDGKMRAVSARGGTVDSLRVAVLAALNIADELATLRERYDDLAGTTATSQTTMRNRAGSLAGMLDEVLDGRLAGWHPVPISPRVPHLRESLTVARWASREARPPSSPPETPKAKKRHLNRSSGRPYRPRRGETPVFCSHEKRHPVTATTQPPPHAFRLLAQALDLPIHPHPFSIQSRNRPAKQVPRTPLVEPTFIEQGSSSYTWLGVQRPPVRNA